MRSQKFEITFFICIIKMAIPNKQERKESIFLCISQLLINSLHPGKKSSFCSIDWLIELNWSIDWLIDWLSLVGWLIDWVWLIDWLIGLGWVIFDRVSGFTVLARGTSRKSTLRMRSRSGMSWSAIWLTRVGPITPAWCVTTCTRKMPASQFR